jgi:hypothetical protein
MGENSDLERLVGKMVLDTEFRNMMFEAPEETAASVGVALTPDQLEEIESWDHEVLRLLAELLARIVQYSAVSW